MNNKIGDLSIVIVGRRAQQIIAVAFTYQNHINIMKGMINYGI